MDTKQDSQTDQGRSQKFVSEGDKTGGLGTEVPQRGPGAEPWWWSGGEAREAEDIYANNNCSNALTKKPTNFFSMGIFGGGGMSPLSPSPFPTPLKQSEDLTNRNVNVRQATDYTEQSKTETKFLFHSYQKTERRKRGRTFVRLPYSIIIRIILPYCGEQNHEKAFRISDHTPWPLPKAKKLQ